MFEFLSDAAGAQWRSAAGGVVVAAALTAVFRRVEVRLVLLVAAILLGLIGGRPTEILRTFLVEMVNPAFVIPICCSLGFVQVVKVTECDRHLVNLLVEPLRRVKALLIPGAVLLGFLVNIPVISQTGTAATIGPVVLPLLRAAGLSPLTGGGAVLLGASIGGELLNPGGPEFGTIVTTVEELGREPPTRVACLYRSLPFTLIQLFVSTCVFWGLSLRWERSNHQESEGAAVEPPAVKVNLVLALVPLTPLVLLFLCSKPFSVVPVPPEWLATEAERKLSPSIVDVRLIGAAMLVGTAVAGCAALVTGRCGAAPILVHSFFEGAGYAYREVISLIVVANCFAVGVRGIGLGTSIEMLTHASPALLAPLSVLATAGFAFVCGSGIAATQGFFPVFAGAAAANGVDPTELGAITVVGAAAGRTASPVAAVAIMTAHLAQVEPLLLVRRVFFPIAAGLFAALVFAVISLRL